MSTLTRGSDVEVEFRLKDLRERERLTQGDLGRRLRVSASHIAEIELGRARPSFDLLLRLAEFFGVPIDGPNGLIRRIR